MMESFLTQIPTLILSLIALLFAIRAHQLSLHINNEHILSDHKLQSAKEVLFALNDLMNSLQSGFYLVKYNLQNQPADEDEILEVAEAINDAADEIDDKADQFHSVIISGALVLPKKAIKELEKILDNIYVYKPIDELTKDNLDQFENHINDLLKQFEKMTILLRKDSHIDVLNSNSYKRLQKVRRV